MFKRILACLMVLLTLVSYLPPRASAEETQPQEETTEVSATQPSEPATVPTTEPTAATEETTAPTQPETTPAEETSADETLPEETLVDTYALPGDDGAVASGKCGENLTWSIDVEGGTLTISGTGAMWDYTDIVENGMIHTTAPWYAYSPVKLILEEGISHIGDYAFEGCSSITGSLTLPESLTSIGHYAFRCGGFTGGLTLPEGLKSIGVGAFMGWSSLTSVTIPRSVTSIDSSAFSFCENMENIFVAEGNTGYTSVNGVLFNKNITTLVTYPTGKKGTTYQIPEGVTEISVYSFGGCNNLTGVTIPEGVTVIGGVAFLNCSNLTSVTIPESVTEIGMGAFNSCLSLTSITIPKGVTYIDEFTFNECHSLTSVVIPRSVTRIGSSAFSGCDGVKDVYYAGSQSQWNGIEISDGNDSLLSTDIHFDPSGSTGSGTFGDNLTWSVDAEGTLTISGTGAIPDFEYVMGETPNSIYGGANTPWRSYLIRKVVVNEGITSVGSIALAYLEKMESISLPASLRELGSHALANNFGLKQIVLPENLETLDEMALFQCSGLSSLHIPAGVKSIGESAIDGCRLDSITVDEANTAFCAEDGVLYTKDKKELLAITSNRTELTIPDSVTRVGSALFFDGQNIVSVTIGAQCDWGMNLSLCNRLEQITVVDSNPYLCAKDNVLFSKDGTELIVYPSARPSTSYTVPAGTKKIGIQAFGDCQNLTSIVLPDGLTEIDSSGIGCAYLAEITIPASVTTIGQEAVGFQYGTKLQNLVIRGAAGSAAESYAKENGFTFVEIGATSGKCGENLTWSVDAEGTLTISGTGAMWDYTSVSEDGNWRTTAPWYALSPVKLVLNEGISYIGCEAFRGCGFAGSLTIPKSVTRLGREAFRDCQNLTNVVIPASLTSIKYGAFAGCTGLTSVTIPEGVTAIEPFAFRNCSSLTGVVIPEGVTCIPDFTFDGCASLTSITIPESVTSVSYGAFNGCSSLKDVYYLGTQAQWEKMAVYSSNEPLLNAELHVNSAGYVVFGSCGENLTWGIDTDGTLTISGTGDMQDYDVVSENDAWHTTAPWYAYSPKKLVLEEGITHVGKSAFVGCGFTGELTIPKGVTDIGYRAFGYCSGFTGSVTLPEGLTKIGSSAFASCSGLTGVTLPQSMTEIGWSAFDDCSSLVDMVIPEGVTAIEGFAFFGCSSLTSVTIPRSVASISDFAFDDCSGLKDVYYAGNQAQWNKIKIGDGNEPLLGAKLHLITGYGICGENLTWILTEDGVLTISGTGEMTDYPNFADVPWNAYREKILSVVMEPGVTSVGRYAFFQCINMTIVEMPEGVTSIGNNAFSACRNLTSVVIPESVTNIGFAAFMACNGLTSVTIPAGVASISSTSFGACFILENIFVDEGNTVYASADGILFNKDQTTLITYPAGKKNTTYIIPEGVTNIASCAVYNCGYLTSVTIPRSVASIGDNAFDFCYNLRDISVDEGNEAYASVDGVLFNKERTVLVTYPAGKENTAYTIPDGVTNVGRSAFWDCMLTSIVIPESVTKIEWGAFRDCSNLKDVYYVGSQRQWEQVQIAEYNEPLLNAAIHFNSVGPCPELTLDREYITLSVGAEPVQLQSFPEYARKAVVWSVENPDGVNVIEVSGDGCVTPLNAGTAYVVASLNTGDGTLTARCRVDVTGTAGSEDVLGVDLGTKKVTTELYSTDYAKIDILLLLEQDEVALFAMPADNGSAITGAYLEDENARQFFDLRVKDDRQLLLVPTQEALDNAKGVKSSYSSKIVVLVNGVEYHTDDAVTISVRKTMPKLKAANLTFNPFYTEESQTLTITGGTVTKVEGTTPEWLTMDGTKLTLSNAPKSGSASLNLLVYTTEWAIPVNVKASVKLSYKAPRLKLSASSVTLSETDSLGVTLKLTAGKQSLEELNVKSVTLPAGFEDTELNLYTGEIALVPIGEIPTGKQAVRVSFYGTDSVLDLPLRVNKRTPTLRLSKTSVSLNAELGDSMTLKVTATPADLDLAKVTVTNPSEALEVSPVNEDGEFTVTVKQGSASKASYALTVQAPTSRAVKLTVRTLAAGQKVTMSLKAAGSIDLTFPEKGVALQPKYRNYAGELENVVYTLALKQGKVTLDAAFDDYLTIGEDGLIRWNGTGSLESGNVCLITMTGELPNGTMLFATAQVRVTETPVILRLSKARLSLNKRLEEKTQVTVTTSIRGYTLGDVGLLVTDNKNVPSDGLTAAYENGLLTLSVNEKTVYGGSYKVQLWVTPKRVTTLMVRIPAEKKSAVTMTARARGGIDVIRDASEVVVTSTYRNCLDGASLKKQVKVTWAQDGRNYSQDVTEDFILTWAQDGTLHVSKVPGKRLALTGKYRLEILCEGMEKEAYTALSVKCGTARFTVASVSLYAKDANDMARLTITTTDKTVNTPERVELKDARLKGTYEVLDLGGGQFALCLIPGAKAKTGTVTLNLFCEGNTTAKPSGTVSVKVEIR